MMRLTTITVSVLGFLVLGSFAQDSQPQGKKHRNVTWYQMVNVDFRHTRAEDGIRIIYDHFIPAANKADLPPMRIFEYATGGDWDVTMLFPMKGGPGELEWEIHPDEEKWMAALAGYMGSEDNARKLVMDYTDMIDRVEMQVVRERIRLIKIPRANPG